MPSDKAWTDSERAMLDEHRARRAAEASRRVQADAEQAQEDDIRSATRAIFELLNDHEKRIDAMTLHGHTVAQQVAELTIGMQQLQKKMPDLMAQGLTNAISDPQTWVNGRKAMQEAASKAAGGWLIGLLSSVFRQAMLFVVLLLVAYQTGGLSLLLSVLKLRASVP